MQKIVFDIETSNIFSEVGSNNSVDLDISVVCIYDYNNDKYSSYTVDQLSELWPILEKADMVIGYNSDHFDLPLLDKYYPGDLFKIKSLDLLKEIRASYGRRVKLDDIASGTLGTKKSGHGLEAVTWWRNGEVDKVIKYCIDDVRITKDVYEYALKNSKLKLDNRGEVVDIALDTSMWEPNEDNSMTHTLPF